MALIVLHLVYGDEDENNIVDCCIVTIALH